MKLNLSAIKKTILDETQQERKSIQTMYQESCKKASKLAWSNRLLFLLCVGVFVYGMYSLYQYGYPVAALIISAVVAVCFCPPFFVMLSEGDISFYDNALDKTLRKNKAYHATIQSVEEKKNQIVKSDPIIDEYLVFLKGIVKIYIANDTLSFVEQFGNKTKETITKEKDLDQKVESLFAGTMFFVFSEDYSDVHFAFSHSVTGKSLLGTKKTLTISLDDDDVENETISYKSWENCW